MSPWGTRSPLAALGRPRVAARSSFAVCRQDLLFFLFSSTGLHVLASRQFVAWGCHGRGETTKVPLRIVVWLSGQESQGTHSGFGTFQNVSSVRFLRVKGMWSQEKKSAEGRSWCRWQCIWVRQMRGSEVTWNGVAVLTSGPAGSHEGPGLGFFLPVPLDIS